MRRPYDVRSVSRFSRVFRLAGSFGFAPLGLVVGWREAGFSHRCQHTAGGTQLFGR